MRSERMLLPEGELEKTRTVYEVLMSSKKKYGERTAYRQIEYGGEESAITFSELAEKVEALRKGLTQTGMSGKRIAIIGETSVEWLSVYFAVISGVGVCVPIDKELSCESIALQLNKAEVDAVFTTEKYLKKVLEVLPECQKIKSITVMRGEYPKELPEGVTAEKLSELEEKGREAQAAQGEREEIEINPDNPCLIIFTSGTTGANKGVELTNGNILGSLRGCARLLRIPEVSLSVLPVNHSYELHANILYCLYSGTCVCVNDELRRMMRNMKRFQPEMSCMVPMMLDTIVAQIKKEIKRSGKEKKFEKTRKLSNALLKLGIDMRRRLFGEILSSLGGKLRMIVCGGAALNQTTADFLSAIGIDVYNGYGITECSPVVAVNSVKLIKKGSAGRILHTLEARIADADENGNGEIQLRGEGVMKGYYKADEDTKKVFTEDGWFKTGDIGWIDEDKYVWITGRIKNLIILSNGKNIYPEELEAALMKKLPYIKECVVTADDGSNGLFAHIYPEPEFRAANGEKTAEEIKALIKKDVDEYNISQPTYKRIADFKVRDREFEKNTTQKILRNRID